MSPALDYARLADLYDSIVTVQDDLDFFRERCAETEGPILELMAGTGRISLALIREGVKLTCVDSAPDMLDVLRGKLAEAGLDAPLVLQDVTQLDLPRRFSLAFIGFQSLAELLSEDDRRRTFESVHRVLTPGGRFIATLHDPEVRRGSVGPGREVEHRIECGDGSTLLMRVELDLDPTGRFAEGVERISCWCAKGELVEERQIPLRFALVERHEVEALARTTGYELLEVLGTYDGQPHQAGVSPYMIFVMRRP